jgi:hypothetical protein
MERNNILFILHHASLMFMLRSLCSDIILQKLIERNRGYDTGK